ncbi:MAG: hypothetical protein DRG78_03460 [Epsilonproteobacteria bacterium]|nr:MAG: hypothetical protein DRG78_03460 [Campylobacterota bacterium]
MFEVLITSFASKIISALVAFILIWGLLRLLDKFSGVDFRARITEINNMEFAVYNGARLIALCLLVGMIMS